MNTKIALIAALAPVSIALAFSFAAPAQAKGQLVDACHAGSKTKVISCCNSWVKSNGLPIWMGGTNVCSSAAVCVGGGSNGGKQLVAEALIIKSPKPCGIQILTDDVPSTKNPGRPTRTLRVAN